MPARWGLVRRRDLTKVNSTTDTMDDERLAVGRPHVLYPRALSSERHEIFLALDLRGGHRRRIGFPEVLPRTSSVTLRGVIPMPVISGAMRRLSQPTRLMTPQSFCRL
jgi:hypothetical protein